MVNGSPVKYTVLGNVYLVIEMSIVDLGRMVRTLLYEWGEV